MIDLTAPGFEILEDGTHVTLFFLITSVEIPPPLLGSSKFRAPPDYQVRNPKISRKSFKIDGKRKEIAFSDRKSEKKIACGALEKQNNYQKLDFGQFLVRLRVFLPPDFEANGNTALAFLR